MKRYAFFCGAYNLQMGGIKSCRESLETREAAKECCEKYFGMLPRKAMERARLHQLPVPAYRGGSQKSEWLISANDLAQHIDGCRKRAMNDWQRLNNS
ncbi:pyocin activator PrtN family protein [Microbulbifer spongiae]|uniref:Pyocin activator PrtN family protein n=1 Tax=Microbulbifer spongiae TaxID=2944933 RepID=A0ABY9E7Y1_9GAMM|nr:pyocin activator PrtN family protein [Microbulbifer sp. MI-G]WKD49103.1 pyocin activator PrtN family protein [Microbulbifer sp. MI-G]